jgi:hypothetical protein
MCLLCSPQERLIEGALELKIRTTNQMLVSLTEPHRDPAFDAVPHSWAIGWSIDVGLSRVSGAGPTRGAEWIDEWRVLDRVVVPRRMSKACRHAGKFWQS